MNIAVCVKQIPDPANPYSLEPGSHRLVRPNEQVLDDTDRYGVEMALQLAAPSGGAVTLVSMGPSGSLQGIRQALAMGATDAIVIDDTSLGGADSLVTARALAAAIAQRGFDLVIAGTESTDGYSGVVPQMMAELLDMPALTYATEVKIEGDSIGIHRQTDVGYDVVEAKLPAVVTVTAGVVEPRYPTFKGIMDAKKKNVESLTVSQLGIDPTVGQQVLSVDDAPARQAGTKLEDDGQAHLAVIQLLEELKVI